MDERGGIVKAMYKCYCNRRQKTHGCLPIFAAATWILPISVALSALHDVSGEKQVAEGIKIPLTGVLTNNYRQINNQRNLE